MLQVIQFATGRKEVLEEQILEIFLDGIYKIGGFVSTRVCKTVHQRILLATHSLPVVVRQRKDCFPNRALFDQKSPQSSQSSRATTKKNLATDLQTEATHRRQLKRRSTPILSPRTERSVVEGSDLTANQISRQANA